MVHSDLYLISCYIEADTEIKYWLQRFAEDFSMYRGALESAGQESDFAKAERSAAIAAFEMMVEQLKLARPSELAFHDGVDWTFEDNEVS